MRKNTGFLLGMFFCLALVFVVVFLFVVSHDAFLIVPLVILFIVAGMCAGASCTDRGMVCELTDLNDGTYTYLGHVDFVYILKYIDSKGHESNYAITELPIVYGPANSKELLSGMSFKKVGDKIVVL